MKTFTYMFSTPDSQIQARVVEANDAEEATLTGGGLPSIFETTLPVLVLEGDFRGLERARNCLREVSYFLSGASHLSEAEMADYVSRTLNAFESIER